MPAALTSDVTALDFTDEHIDAIFAESSIDFGELAAFVRQVRATFIQAPDESIERRHVEAMIRSSREADEEGRSGARRGSSRWEAEARPAPWRHIGARLGPRLAAAALVIAVLSGGLAATGNLPDGMQSAAARIAQRFGITLEAPKQRSGNGDGRSEGPPSLQGNGDTADEASDPAQETTGRDQPKANSSDESGESQRGDGSGPHSSRDDGRGGSGTGRPDSGGGTQASAPGEAGPPADTAEGPPPGKPEGPPPGKPEGPPPGKPEGPPPGKPEGPSQGKPEEADGGTSPGGGKEKPKDDGKEQDKPQDAGNDKPQDAGKDKPEDAGKDKPEDAGKDKPEDAGKDDGGSPSGNP
jgi:hypothetical protein